MFTLSVILISSALTVQAFGRIGENFNFSSIQDLVEGEVFKVPSNHYTLCNTQALLSLANCLIHNINNSSFDVRNIELLDEYVREKNKQKLIELGACDESFSQCLPTLPKNETDRYIANLIFDKAQLCIEIEEAEKHYIFHVQNTSVYTGHRPYQNNLSENNQCQNTLDKSDSSKPRNSSKYEEITIVDASLYILLSINCFVVIGCVIRKHIHSNCARFDIPQ